MSIRVDPEGSKYKVVAMMGVWNASLGPACVAALPFLHCWYSDSPLLAVLSLLFFFFVFFCAPGSNLFSLCCCTGSEWAGWGFGQICLDDMWWMRRRGAWRRRQAACQKRHSECRIRCVLRTAFVR
jgi:hypothetical protein